MRYSAVQGEKEGFHTVELRDSETDLAATIAPGLGNNCFSLVVSGLDFLFSPAEPIEALIARKALFGVPFLSPWANRLDHDGYWANGARFLLNRDLNNIRSDQHGQPIHGLLLFESWSVEDVRADATAAQVTSRFAFTAHPRLMAQFPFAHHLLMRHRVQDGRLHVSISVVSECLDPIPVSLGFHPYFTLPGTGRNDWTLHLAARKHLELNERSIPTGILHDVGGNGEIALATANLDDAYSDLSRDSVGYAVFDVTSPRARLRVGFGPQFPVAVIYAPPSGNFVCIEPMAAATNALNNGKAGLKDSVAHAAPGSFWQEEFWVEPSILS
jgi:aldose 1-epimerase